MPSALPNNPSLLGRMVGVLAGKMGGKDGQTTANDRIARLGMSERQQVLNRLWAVYKCAQYDHRKLDWNGQEVVGGLDAEVIATQGFVPPGFFNAGNASQPLPLKFRRPTAAYALVTVIVDRFTGLLFSEQQHPEIKVDGDPATEDFLHAVSDVARLWQQMILARTYGGAMGSVAIGFQFIEGKPVIEVHDPRWVFPQFSEHGSTSLISLEKRYRYPKEERDPATGRWETKEYWYRRVIDEQSDVLYAPAPVDKGEEPTWVEAKRVDHGFGFCPVVWVQNLPVQEIEDGDTDCPRPVYDTVEAIDTLVAQANRAILANCDPRLVLTTKAEMGEVNLAPDKALRLPEGDAKFLEVQATGPKAALELATQLRANTLEMSQCVLEHPDVAAKTATEIERMYQSMLSKADKLREQYGQKGILPLLEMMYRAATVLSQPRPIPAPEPALEGNVVPLQAGAGAPHQEGDGQQSGQEQMDGIMVDKPGYVRGQIVLPPRYEEGLDGTKVAVERVPGTGGTITLKWPGYFQPTLQDVQLASTAATGAKAGGLIDDETAISFVAPYFKVEDKADLVKKVRAAAAQESANMMAMMASSTQGAGEEPGAAPGGEAPAPPPGSPG